MQVDEALQQLLGGAEGVARWNAWREVNEEPLPNLERAPLAGADLRGANLRGIRLFRTDFSGARLQGADLSETNCSEANFAGANLVRLTARGAKLFRIDFTGADLSQAALAGAYLGESLLLDVKLCGADLSNTRGLRLSQLESVEVDSETKLPDSLRQEFAGFPEAARKALPKALAELLE